MMKFVIRGRYWKGEKTFPSLNDYIHALAKSPTSGAKIKKDHEKIACDAIRKHLKRQKAPCPVTLHYKFYEPQEGQIRDHMNVFSFADKVIEDALIKCGTIQDDSPQYVDGNKILHEFRYTSGTPYIEVEIVEL